MKRLLALLIPFLLVTQPAFAQYASGTVSAMLDAQTRSWQVVEPDQDGGSHWKRENDGVSIRLVAHEAPEVLSRNPGLTLSFKTDGLGAEAEAQELSVILTQTTENGTLKAMPADTDITLSALTVAGERLVISGDFTAILSPEDAGMSAEAEDEGSVTMVGDFQATLPYVDDPDG
ncbi:hypothetical protein ACSQ76_13865 [Roseovarius sp. B08]|uniref:hypothetical protein n=1 Tax=Roseovarius sp. B08 TaxID=3449223 RepID=UPI003EDB8B7D